MRRRTLLRVVGIAGILAAYGIFELTDGERAALIVAVVGIVALVAPSVLDRLPFGPDL